MGDAADDLELSQYAVNRYRAPKRETSRSTMYVVRLLNRKAQDVISVLSRRCCARFMSTATHREYAKQNLLDANDSEILFSATQAEMQILAAYFLINGGDAMTDFPDIERYAAEALREYILRNWDVLSLP